MNSQFFYLEWKVVGQEQEGERDKDKEREMEGG
jgi:hypothetical protein